MEAEDKKKVEIKVSGMTCATCALTIEKSLKGLEGVADAHVDLARIIHTLSILAGAFGRLLRSPHSQSSTYHTGTPPVAPLCGLESDSLRQAQCRQNRRAKLKLKVDQNNP
jgi:copper chaperone CopZ